MLHTHALVDPKAKIAPNVTIGPFTYIEGDVEIGEGSWIGSNVTIMNGTRLGKNCQVFPGAVLGAIPQDVKFNGEITTAEIGDNTVLREYVTVNRGTKEKGKTVVGKNCLILAYSHIAHDCIISNNCGMSNNTQIAGHVFMDEYSWIGGASAIHQFVRIGKHAFLSGGSLVSRDIPPYSKIVYNPISYGGINRVGLVRNGFDSEAINRIVNIYRAIYYQDLNVSQAVAFIEENVPDSPEKKEITSFIQTSKIGIVRRLRGIEDKAK